MRTTNNTHDHRNMKLLKYTKQNLWMEHIYKVYPTVRVHVLPCCLTAENLMPALYLPRAK